MNDHHSSKSALGSSAGNNTPVFTPADAAQEMLLFSLSTPRHEAFTAVSTLSHLKKSAPFPKKTKKQNSEIRQIGKKNLFHFSINI